MPRLVFIVTVPVTADVLLRGQLTYLRERGYDITVISSPGPELERVERRESVRTVAIPMSREMSPAHDAMALRAVYQALQSLEPDVVNASTPKAGLLGMIAARALRVPVRVYQLRGLRLETERGMRRRILAGTERIAAACAHRVICNSESLRDRFVAAGFGSAHKCVVLGAGSSNGVDVSRFEREHWRVQANQIRQQLGIASSAFVIGFVGRPVADKGIGELIATFERVVATHPETHLVLVGAGWADEHLSPQLARAVRRANVHVIPRLDEPAPYYAVMDVLAFPSYREGLPNVPLEAAASGVPTVGFNATGVRDVVEHGRTGLLVEIGDFKALADALQTYIRDPALLRQHGSAARDRVTSNFAREIVWQRWSDEYDALLNQAGTRTRT